MPEPPINVEQLPTEDWRPAEAVLDRFEEHWRRGCRPSLRRALAGVADVVRPALVRELVRIDLEYRLAAGDEPPLVEDYQAAFPTALADTDFLLELVLQEWRGAAGTLQGTSRSDREADYRRRFPGLADALEAAWAKEMTPDTPRESTLTSTQEAPSKAAVAETRPATSALRYRIEQFHAKGGLGEVYVAADTELNRPVALKCIQAPLQDDPESRRRFLAEAEVTARLEHPGVVPVYGLVHDEYGRPAYAMRFIAGETLRHAIERFHEARGNVADGRSGQARAVDFESAEFRQLLQRFLAVCNTVAYAHSREIIHRDLKPANMMAGPYGETLVLDWGLAKSVSAVAAGMEESPSGPDFAGTSAGTPKGTPSYMSPEQAGGRVHEVTGASDIFGLGATLYALLTGRAPFRGKSRDEIIERAARAEFPPPRSLDRRIPPALEAVCLKAMSPAPADRYGSALDLATDVERWLADEPVSAYVDPWWNRLRRWGRRHRPVVTGATVLLVAAVVGLALGLWAVRAEQAKTAIERDIASRNLALAKEAVDQCFLIATTEPLLQQESLRSVRKLLLEKALPFYQNFRAQRPDDPLLRRELAQNYSNVAFITSEVGRLEDSLEAYDRAIDLWRQEDAADPNLAGTLRQLAAACYNRGVLLVKLHRTEPAAEALRESRRIRQRLAKTRPELPEAQLELAEATGALAALEGERGRYAEALGLLEEAEALLRPFVRPRPEWQAAARAYSQTLDNLAECLAVLGRRPEALKVRAEALEQRRQGVARWPAEALFRRDLAVTLTHVGQRAEADHDWQAAGAAYNEARDILQKLATEAPDATEYRLRLAQVYEGLGSLARQRNEPDAAVQALKKAVELQEGLRAMDPSHVRYSADLSNTYNTLGNLHADRREWEQARDAYRASRRLRQELAERHPDIPEYRLGLAGNACNLGNVERDAGRPAEAVPWYRAADELLEPLRVRFPNAPAVRNFSRNTYVGLGMALSRLCRHEESLANWQKALALAPQFEKERDRLRVEWAVCLAAAGQLEAAQHEIESLKQRYTRDGSMLVHLARVAARASAVQGLPQDLADRWAERAVEFLLAAAELRHFDDQDHRAELARNPDLAPLKARPEFMKLVESPDGG